MDEIPAVKRCPRDRTELETFEHGGLTLDACPTCGGIWMELTEFSRVVKQVPDLEAVEDEIVPDPSYTPKEGFETCPAGCGQMERFDYAATRTIILDRCSKCGGIWLDDGECRAIAQKRQSDGRNLTPAQQMDMAEFCAEHEAVIDHLQAEQGFFQQLGRRWFWLDGAR